jgi:hypothetical protein
MIRVLAEQTDARSTMAAPRIPLYPLAHANKGIRKAIFHNMVQLLEIAQFQISHAIQVKEASLRLREVLLSWQPTSLHLTLPMTRQSQKALTLRWADTNFKHGCKGCAFCSISFELNFTMNS